VGWALKHISTILQKLIEELENAGLEIWIDVMIKGVSGVTHHFDLLVSHNERKVIVDEIEDDNQELDIIGFYTRLFDVNADSGLVIVENPTTKAKALAELYNMRIMSPDDGTMSIVSAIRDSLYKEGKMS
jgi:HKD family nuclease